MMLLGLVLASLASVRAMDCWGYIYAEEVETAPTSEYTTLARTTANCLYDFEEENYLYRFNFNTTWKRGGLDPLSDAGKLAECIRMKLEKNDRAVFRLNQIDFLSGKDLFLKMRTNHTAEALRNPASVQFKLYEDQSECNDPKLLRFTDLPRPLVDWNNLPIDLIANPETRCTSTEKTVMRAQGSKNFDLTGAYITANPWRQHSLKVRCFPVNDTVYPDFDTADIYLEFQLNYVKDLDVLLTNSNGTSVLAAEVSSVAQSALERAYNAAVARANANPSLKRPTANLFKLFTFVTETPNGGVEGAQTPLFKRYFNTIVRHIDSATRDRKMTVTFRAPFGARFMHEEVAIYSAEILELVRSAEFAEYFNNHLNWLTMAFDATFNKGEPNELTIVYRNDGLFDPEHNPVDLQEAKPKLIRAYLEGNVTTDRRLAMPHGTCRITYFSESTCQAVNELYYASLRPTVFDFDYMNPSGCQRAVMKFDRPNTSRATLSAPHADLNADGEFYFSMVAANRTDGTAGFAFRTEDTFTGCNQISYRELYKPADSVIYKFGDCIPTDGAYATVRCDYPMPETSNIYLDINWESGLTPQMLVGEANLTKWVTAIEYALMEAIQPILDDGALTADRPGGRKIGYTGVKWNFTDVKYKRHIAESDGLARPLGSRKLIVNEYYPVYTNATISLVTDPITAASIQARIEDQKVTITKRFLDSLFDQRPIRTVRPLSATVDVRKESGAFTSLEKNSAIGLVLPSAIALASLLLSTLFL